MTSSQPYGILRLYSICISTITDFSAVEGRLLLLDLLLFSLSLKGITQVVSLDDAGAQESGQHTSSIW